MKRKTTKSDAHNIIYDGERVLGIRVLQALGELVILWNAIEAEMDAALVYATNMPMDLWTSVRSRISGLEAKRDILKECLDPVLWFQPEEQRLLADTLGDFMTLKGYRDSLVHVRLYRVWQRSGENTYKKKLLAFAPEKRGARYEILFSRELLLAVNRRLRLFQKEMHALNTLVSMRFFSIRAENAQATFGWDSYEQRITIERTTRADWKSLRANRKRRLALPPLPEFPAEDQAEPQAGDDLLLRRRRAFEAQIKMARASRFPNSRMKSNQTE